jgi:trigger factor
MKVTIEKLPPSQVKLGIEVDGEKSQAIYDRQVKRLVSNVQVPGFRRGKAPKELVLRQVGVDAIRGSVMEQLIEETSQQALKDNADLKAIGELRLKDGEELMKVFQVGQPFSFEVLVDVEPEVSLKQYTGFNLQVPAVQPDLDYADRTLHQYRIRKSTLVPVDDRPAQLGDVVTIDLEVFDTDSGKLLEDFSESDLQIDLETEVFIPEVVQALVGAKEGDEVEAIAKLPSHLCPDALRDKSLRFIATVNDLKTRELPPLDDEFARSISEKETMAELRAYLDHRAAEEAQAQTKRRVELALLDTILAQTELEVPASMLQSEVNALMSEKLRYLQPRLEETVFKQLLNSREMLTEIANSSQPEAILRIRRSLVIGKVAELENIRPSSEEIDDAFNSALEDNPELIKNHQQQGDLISSIISSLATEKVLSWLISQSTIEFVEESAEPTSEGEVEVSAETIAALEGEKEET